MFTRIKEIFQSLGSRLSSGVSQSASKIKTNSGPITQQLINLLPNRNLVIACGVVGFAAYEAYQHPPITRIEQGEVGVRTNQLTGDKLLLREGAVWVFPGLHAMRAYSLRDQIYRPSSGSDAPFQSIEGLSLGVDLSVRYAINPEVLTGKTKGLPDDINADIIDPTVQSVIYKVFTAYTVREIFSSKRAAIQQEIETELKPKLAAEGILLRNVMIGKIDLPADYKRGMENLLAQELETEKMRYTLELKEKHVKQTALEAEAEKVRRETEAEATGNEQIIAAKAQAEAMKHVLPFKQKQIEQRQLEAEADKITRVKMSEAMAQARVIEAQGEADSRRKLADVEVYRQEQIGKVSSAQLERDGEALSKHPLLIQKAMADKLSDKVSVIIASPSQSGFIGDNLLGTKTTAVNP